MLKRSIAIAVLAFGFSATAPSAQPSAITRTVLQKSDFPSDKYTSMLVMVEIAPGAKVPFHTHPGIEFAYVVDGDGSLSVEGQPDRHVKTGDSSQVPAVAPHSFTNLSADKPVKLVVTYVVEKDKPLTTIVQK